jgi:thiol-disulfide isomerase/thioredoxin
VRTFVALAVFIVAACVGWPAAAQEAEVIAIGSPAPRVTVNDLDGKPVDLGRFLGKKPVLLEWWATWCEQCETLLPRLQAAHKEVGEAVQFIGVNVAVNQSPDRVRRYLREQNPPFLALYDDQGTSTRAYRAPSTSYVVIVDRTGRIAYTGIGGDQAFLEALRRVATK